MTGWAYIHMQAHRCIGIGAPLPLADPCSKHTASPPRIPVLTICASTGGRLWSGSRNYLPRHVCMGCVYAMQCAVLLYCAVLHGLWPPGIKLGRYAPTGLAIVGSLI